MDIPQSVPPEPTLPYPGVQNVQLEQAKSQTFNIKDLTPEDRKILKNVNREAAIYRGYPSAIFFGGLTYYSLRSVSKISSAGRLGCAIFAGILGSIVGRASYIPTIMKKLEVELPLDSPLRELIKQSSEKTYNKSSGPPYSNVSPRSTPMHQPPQLSTSAADDIEVVADDGKSQVKKFYSYDELRKAHREKERNIEKSSLSPAKVPLSELGGNYSDMPEADKKVRYNKYGDPILE